MADKLDIDVQDGKLVASLGLALLALDEPGGLLDRIGSVFERNVQLRFETKTDPSGAPWAELADSTKESYKRKYKGSIPGSLLERSRHMRDSLGYNVIGKSVEVGFAEIYPGYHETGSKDGKHPPRRGLLTENWQTGELGEQDRDDILAEIEDYLNEAQA